MQSQKKFQLNSIVNITTILVSILSQNTTFDFFLPLSKKETTSGETKTTKADPKPAKKGQVGDATQVEPSSKARKGSSAAVSSSASSSISEKGDVTDAKTDNNDATQVE